MECPCLSASGKTDSRFGIKKAPSLTERRGFSLQSSTWLIGEDVEGAEVLGCKELHETDAF